MAMEMAARRQRVRAQLLSYRGHALIGAVSIAVIMIAILAIAMTARKPDQVQRAPLRLDEPGPPPISIPSPTKPASPTSPVRMKPIACPDSWDRPNVTCWQAQ